MSLVACKDCGAEVSSKAKACVNCGAKPPKKTSIITWIVLVLIIYFIYSIDFSSYPHSSPKVEVEEKKPILDILTIIGKNQGQIQQIIGSPINCANTKFGVKCSYNSVVSEIIFIQDKADWITVDKLKGIPFDRTAPRMLGLNLQEPTFENEYMMRWSSALGLKEVQLFKGANNSDYVYIKSYTL